MSALVTWSIRRRIETVHAVAIPRLISAKLRSQALILGQTTDQICLGASLDHLQLVVADVFFLQALDFRVDGITYLLRGMPGQRKSIKGEQVRILDARQPGDPAENDAIFLSRTNARLEA